MYQGNSDEIRRLVARLRELSCAVSVLTPDDVRDFATFIKTDDVEPERWMAWHRTSIEVRMSVAGDVLMARNIHDCPDPRRPIAGGKAAPIELAVIAEKALKKRLRMDACVASHRASRPRIRPGLRQRLCRALGLKQVH